MAHYDIFRDQLAIMWPTVGHALWEPEPSPYSPIDIGDVGFVREGKFHRLFNALRPEKDPSHGRFGVPEHYEQLIPKCTNHIFPTGTLGANHYYSVGVNITPTESVFKASG